MASRAGGAALCAAAAGAAGGRSATQAAAAPAPARAGGLRAGRVRLHARKNPGAGMAVATAASGCARDRGPRTAGTLGALGALGAPAPPPREVSCAAERGGSDADRLSTALSESRSRWANPSLTKGAGAGVTARKRRQGGEGGRRRAHTEETRRKISDSVKRSFADRRASELRAGNIGVLEKDVSSFRSDLRKYKRLRAELRPFMERFREREGRDLTLKDLEEAGLPWLISKYKRYLVLREQVVKQSIALRSDLQTARLAATSHQRDLMSGSKAGANAVSSRGAADSQRRSLARALAFESAQERAHEYRRAIQAKRLTEEKVDAADGNALRRFVEGQAGGNISATALAVLQSKRRGLGGDAA